MSDVFCEHDDTTAPDGDGYVICVDCLRAVKRPHTRAEMIDEINRHTDD